MSSTNSKEFSGHIRALLAKQPGEKPLQEEIVDDDIEGKKKLSLTLWKMTYNSQMKDLDPL
jgi:hypothetical protein